MEDIEWCRENVECYEELMRIINREFYNAGRDLDDAEKAIAKESMVAGKMRGQGEKTIMEDGLSI